MILEEHLAIRYFGQPVGTVHVGLIELIVQKLSICARLDRINLSLVVLVVLENDTIVFGSLDFDVD